MLRFILVFATFFLFAQFVSAMTIDDSSTETNNAAPTSEDSSIRSLNGNFIALSKQRMLSTSVGNFQLEASTRVIDRRLDPQAKNKVTIRFRDDHVSEVTIYQ